MVDDNDKPIEYTGPERRVHSKDFRELEDRIELRIRQHMEKHEKKENDLIEDKFDQLTEMLKSAFPGGDPAEHRRYHEATMAYLNERSQLFKAVREKTVTGLVWAMVVFGGTAILNYIRTKLGHP